MPPGSCDLPTTGLDNSRPCQPELASTATVNEAADPTGWALESSL